MRAAQPSRKHRCREGVKRCRIMRSLRITGFRGLARNKAVSRTKDSRKGTVFAARKWPQVEKGSDQCRVAGYGSWKSWGGERVIKIHCMKFSIFEMLKARQERRHRYPKLASSSTCHWWKLIRGPELSGAGDDGIQERPSQQGFLEKPCNDD